MKLPERKKAWLLLEDGLLLEGTVIGKPGTTGGEICFNTGMTGYQEIYTDPSYFGQIVINTTAHIGNYGAIDVEQESGNPQINGLIVNDYSEVHSRNTASSSLQEYLESNNITGIADIDTRMLVRHIRSKGAMNAIISSELEGEDLQKELEKVPSMEGLELASVVSTDKPYIVGEGNKIKVAVLDLGVKKSILTNLVNRGCECKVFPAKTSFEEIQEWKPDGYFLSNGPGDPAVMDYSVETATTMLKQDKAVFGICLGHQIIARTQGIGTYKMHHGHRGLNHPVHNLITGLGEITSQNHGFAISEKDVEVSDKVESTHINLNDNTIEGISVNGKNAFSVQYHPEASPGPHDSHYLFDQFIKNINK
ncbi:MAG: glutamine-hydrolyzing carbamoyl-phosphate synthase small subunit [Bacteroidota bacterium]